MKQSLEATSKKINLEQSWIYFVLFALVILFSQLSPLFFTSQNLINILLATAISGLLAIAATFVIGSGGLDLSVGSVLALTTVVSAVVFNVFASWPLIIIFSLMSGLLVGMVNGIIIAKIKLPAFIVTLGMLSIARGLALVISDGRPIYNLPKEIVFLGQGKLLGLPIPVLILLLSAVIMNFVLKKTVFGLQLVSLGDNEKALYNLGVNVGKLKIKIYTLSGFFAGLAGLVFMARVNIADPSAGMMYELTAITAAIIGGTYLFGGRSSVFGALLGAIIMSVMQNGLTLLAVPSYYQQILIGIVLILVITVDRLINRNRNA